MRKEGVRGCGRKREKEDEQRNDDKGDVREVEKGSKM